MDEGRDQKTMPFLEHVEELRWRLIKMSIALAACSIPAGFFWRRLFRLFMIYPLRFSDPTPHLIITAPADAFMLSIQIAVITGMVAASPVIFYQLWRFIAPGLYRNEIRVVLPLVVFSTLFFLAGVGFSYCILPFLIRFFVRFSRGAVEPYFNASQYIAFLLKICIAFGVVFELPVLSFVFSRLGLLTPRFLVRNFRYGIIIIFILAAVLTPPDPLSQVMLAMPLLLLYGLSIAVSWFARKRKR